MTQPRGPGKASWRGWNLILDLKDEPGFGRQSGGQQGTRRAKMNDWVSQGPVNQHLVMLYQPGPEHITSCGLPDCLPWRLHLGCLTALLPPCGSGCSINPQWESLLCWCMWFTCWDDSTAGLLGKYYGSFSAPAVSLFTGCLDWRMAGANRKAQGASVHRSSRGDLSTGAELRRAVTLVQTKARLFRVLT